MEKTTVTNQECRELGILVTARLKFSVKDFIKILDEMPDDAVIVGANYMVEYSATKFVFSSDLFPARSIYQVVPVIAPIMRRKGDGSIIVESMNWPPGVKEAIKQVSQRQPL